MAAGMSDPIVRFVGIGKTYDGVTRVIDDLHLDVERGEFLTLLGPSGSGKTTTLMMLAGFETPTAGEILLEGKPLSRLPPYKRQIGMVFQNYALFPHMTVAENIGFPLSVRGHRARPRSRKRVERALDMVQLAGFGASPAGAAFRRPAAARRRRARARVRAEARADGRAARRAGQAAARADAARDPAPAPAARRDDGLRDARPGGGAHDVRPHRGVPSREDPAARRAGAALRDAGQRLRRPVHRREQPLRRQPAVGRRQPMLGADRRRCLHRRLAGRAAAGRRARSRSRCGRSGCKSARRAYNPARLPGVDSRGRCAKSSIWAITSGRASRCRATTISPSSGRSTRRTGCRAIGGPVELAWAPEHCRAFARED